MSFDPFAPLPGSPYDMPARAQLEQQQHEAAFTALRAALGHAAGQAWLAAFIAREEARPSYTPGATFDAVAWREGRKAILREIQTSLARTMNPES